MTTLSAAVLGSVIGIGAGLVAAALRVRRSRRDGDRG